MKHLLIILALLFCSCTQKINIQNSFNEGIKNEILHIYISELFTDEFEGNDKLLEKSILKNAESRAMMLLASYITFRINPEIISKESDKKLNFSIYKCLKTIKIISLECDDNNLCRAHISFNAESVISTLKELNKISPIEETKDSSNNN